jgi:hypothetical protein
VYLASQDFTVAGGAAGEVHSDKIVEMMKASLKTGSPFVFINDSGGARIQEGIDSLAAYGRVFFHNTLLSGVVPQISLICGPCAGGAAYSPALTDFIIQTKARRGCSSPARQVIQRVTGEEISAEQLGGTLDAHALLGRRALRGRGRRATRSRSARSCWGFLPSNNMEDAPRRDVDPEIADDPVLNEMVPVNPREPYDVHDVIAADRRRRRLPGDPGALRAQHRDRVRAVCWGGRLAWSRTTRRSGRACWTSTRRTRRAVRPLLQRVQHPDRDARGCAGVPARASSRSTRASSGTGRRLLFAYSALHGAQGDDHPAQGVRRGVCRDEQQGPRGRRGRGVARGGDRGDGRRGRDRGDLPQGEARPAPHGPSNGPSHGDQQGGVASPIAGTVLEVRCKAGDTVSSGQELVVIEAMKMETIIAAPGAGTVKAVLVAAGDSVRESQLLVELS